MYKRQDEYYKFRTQWHEQPLDKQLGNPVHHIHNGAVPTDAPPVTFGLLLNLVGVLGTGASKEQVWNYLGNYVENAAVTRDPELGALIDHALAYNRDVASAALSRRKPGGSEAAALRELDAALAALADDTPADEIQNIVYEIGKNEAYGFENLRDWFKALYETLLGSSAGPRMGSFIALFGIDNTRRLIAEALN